MSPSRRVKASLFCLVLLAGGLATALTGCGECETPQPQTPATSAAWQRFAYEGLKLGSDYRLVLYAVDRPTADAAARAAEAEIDRLDQVFSDYKADSEISKLSRRTADGPMAEPASISPDLHHVLAFSQAMSAATDGAVDVTVGPYVQLWRRSRRQQQLPTPERLAAVRPSVGWNQLQIHPQPSLESLQTASDPTAVGPTAKLLAKDMRLDVGGVATGYISDRVLSVLRQRGITSAICDLSGDLAVGDPPPGRTGWTVGVRSLTEPTLNAEYLSVRNCGVSTSGDTYRFIEIDGVRYSHIVDTRTGLGLTRRIGATAVARDGLTADAAVTAICVTGVDRAKLLLQKLNAEARMVSVEAGGVVVTTTHGYSNLLTSPPAGEQGPASRPAVPSTSRAP